MGMFCPVNSSFVARYQWLISSSKIALLLNLVKPILEKLFHSEDSKSAIIFSGALVVLEFLVILSFFAF